MLTVDIEKNGSSASPCSYNGVLRVETMNGAILQAEGNDSPAFSLLHNQIKSEILNEVVRVILQRLQTNNNNNDEIVFYFNHTNHQNLILHIIHSIKKLETQIFLST